MDSEQLDVGADGETPGRTYGGQRRCGVLTMAQTQCPNCRLRIRTAAPPLHCPRCIVRGRGRFELVALPEDRKPDDREKPVRLIPGDRAAREPAALQIVQTVIWAEARQISVRGELEGASAGALEQLLADTLGSGLPCIVLDLSTCRILDAGALDVIAEMQSQLAAHGQELVVDGATAEVERLIEKRGSASRNGDHRLTEGPRRPTREQR